jgi:hypothetical protein
MLVSPLVLGNNVGQSDICEPLTLAFRKVHAVGLNLLVAQIGKGQLCLKARSRLRRRNLMTIMCERLTSWAGFMAGSATS